MTPAFEPARRASAGTPMGAPGTDLGARRRLARRKARARVNQRTTADLTEGQRGIDALSRGRRTPGQRVAALGVAIVGSLVIHVLAVGAGMIGDREKGQGERFQQEISVRVQSPPPEPPAPPEPPPPPEPEPEPPPEPRPRLRRIAARPPIEPLPTPRAAEPPPEAEPAKPPPRVIGLSLESTTAGGSGPAFAVGNTQAGKTAEVATAPEDVPPEPGLATDEAPTPNRVAAYVPRAGIARTLPQCPRNRKPPYPALLQQQGVEADVGLVVTIDKTGQTTRAKVVTPASYPEFNQAALEYARGERCEPARRNGVPVAYELRYTIRFRLENL